MGLHDGTAIPRHGFTLNPRPSHPLLRYYPRNENFSSHKKLLMNGYMCSIQKLFTNVFCEQINCGNSCDGTLLNNKKEQTTDTPASWVNFKGAVPSERIQSRELRRYIIPFRWWSWKENCSDKNKQWWPGLRDGGARDHKGVARDSSGG